MVDLVNQVFAVSSSAVCQEALTASRARRGCILNWLHFAKKSGCAGWIPILMGRGGAEPPADLYAGNMHKPCLAQQAAFLVREDGGDAEWLREDAMYLQYFLNNYRNHHRHAETGLYFWQNDHAIGVDNDPAHTDVRRDQAGPSTSTASSTASSLPSLTFSINSGSTRGRIPYAPPEIRPPASGPSGVCPTTSSGAGL